MNQSSLSRRHFIQTAAYATAALGASTPAFAQKAGKTIKVGFVGCGGRPIKLITGLREACQILGHELKVVALADIFQDRIDSFMQKNAVEGCKTFTGFDAYHKVIATKPDIIVLATPPVFRAIHCEAAIKAGIHIFAEKPVAVDPVGVRRFLAVGDQAKAKGVSLVVGTQRRHLLTYLENKALLDAGAIGPILGGFVSWNGNVPWIVQRQPGQSAADYLARNWLNFTEMSGDHIVEQHVHQLDVCNWFLGRTPVAAIGMGGRSRRETGNQFDHFAVDYDYGDGVHINSQCRQIAGTYDRVGEFFRGPDGTCNGGGKVDGKNVTVPEIKVESPNGETQEMVELIKSITSKKPLVEAKSVAEATLVAIMGRISAYTGQLIRWSDLMENKESPYYNLALSPTPEDFEKGTVTLPAETPAIPGDPNAKIRVRTT